MKILAVIRSSTDKQETESQKNEMIEFCKSKGFDEIEIIEVAGASAVKLNKKYIQMIEDIKSAILMNNIKYVAFWHLNRLGRNETKLAEMKEFFKTNKIQVYIKYPSIQLFNDDGSLNEGANISWSIFSVMVEKDTEELFAKAKRGKKRNSDNGKYNGGDILYGFRLNSDKYYEINESEAEVVRLIFELYASGKYSASTLAKEMNDRGYSFKQYQIRKMLSNTAYIGYTDNDIQNSHRVYPRIITDELFDKVKEMRLKANTAIDKTPHYMFASKLLKCSECGSSYIHQQNSKGKKGGGVYCCWKRTIEHTCTNKLAINSNNLDRLLWYVARDIHIKYIMSMNNDKINNIENDINLLVKKIDVAKEKKIKLSNKIEKIADNYMNDLISKEKRDKQVQQVKLEEIEYDASIKSYEFKINNLIKLIETIKLNDNPLINRFNSINSIQLNKKEMNDIVKLHIEEVKLRSLNKNTIISIKPYHAPLIEVLYKPFSKSKTKQGWVERYYSLNDKSITEKVYKNSYEFDYILDNKQ